MAYVSIPKDLDAVRNKIMFGLTLRQIICLGAGASIGVPVYFLTKDAIGTTNASLCMMVVLLPAFMMAIFEKDGLPLERVLMNHIRNKYIKPEVRMYKTKKNKTTNSRENSRKRSSKEQRTGNRRKETAVKSRRQNGVTRPGSGKNNRIPGSDIPQNSPIKGTLIMDPFEDREEPHRSGVKVSFKKIEENSDENAPRQPISEEIILQEINKSIGYEYAKDVEHIPLRRHATDNPAGNSKKNRTMTAVKSAMIAHRVAESRSEDAEQDQDTENVIRVGTTVGGNGSKKLVGEVRRSTTNFFRVEDYYIRIYKPRKEEQEADSEDMEGNGSEEEYDDDVDYGDNTEEELDYSDY